MDQPPPRRIGNHDNAFGIIRLVLASLVIVAHTPEIADGNRHRELLYQLFHTITFGELAVDGFFVISGYLITASYIRTSDPLTFLRHRVARIYPAFVISSLWCVLLLAPSVGGHFQRGLVSSVLRVAGRMVILSPPFVSSAFEGTAYPLLNGAAWTIQYEFLMYLVVLGLGVIGLLRFGVVAPLAFVYLLLCTIVPPRSGSFLSHLSIHQYVFQGTGRDMFRLGGTFLAGSALWFQRAHIKPSLSRVGIATMFACFCLSFKPLAHAGFAIWGGYALISLARLGQGTVFARINNRNDISYGLYLYGWPIGKALLWWGAWTSLVTYGAVTWLLTAAAGAASWLLIERRAIAWARKRQVIDSAPLCGQSVVG